MLDQRVSLKQEYFVWNNGICPDNPGMSCIHGTSHCVCLCPDGTTNKADSCSALTEKNKQLSENACKRIFKRHAHG